MTRTAGKVVVVSSPSGGGKTTVIRELLRLDPALRYSVSETTRPPRPGERDGVDYVFTDEDAFRRRIAEGAYLEWARVHGRLYGTPREPVSRWAGAGETVLLDLDVQGALSVKAARPDALLVFLRPPSAGELRRRLTLRGTESEAETNNRLEAASREMEAAERYDVILINDRLEDTVRNLQAVVRHADRAQEKRCA